MAQISGFFDSVNGDRKYSSSFFSSFFGSFIGNGVFPNPASGLQVTSNSNMTITVKAGQAWINGHYYKNDSELILNIDLADGVLNRVDSVILQYNLKDRSITAKIKKGEFDGIGIAPLLQRDADIYELCIADIKVNAGSAIISNANIYDKRFDKNKCGIVTGLIEQIDTTEFFEQYMRELKEFVYKFTNSLDPTKDAAIQLNAKITNIEGTLNTKVTEMESTLNNTIAETKKTITEAVENMKKQAGESILNIFDITILKGNWVLDEVLKMYTYKITDARITTETIVDVNIHLESQENAAELKGVTKSYPGYVILYSESIPPSNLKCDLKMIKGVN